MKDYNARIDKILESLAKTLRETGEFSEVQPGYQGNKQVYAVNNEGTRFLVVVNSLPLRKADEVEEQLREIWEQGIHLGYLILGKEPFFERWGNRARSLDGVVSEEDKKRLIKATKTQTELIRRFSPLQYFSTETEEISLFSFRGDFEAHYEHRDDLAIRPKPRVLTTCFLPSLLGRFDFFSLIPFKNNGSYSKALFVPRLPGQHEGTSLESLERSLRNVKMSNNEEVGKIYPGFDKRKLIDYLEERIGTRMD